MKHLSLNNLIDWLSESLDRRSLSLKLSETKSGKENLTALVQK